MITCLLCSKHVELYVLLASVITATTASFSDRPVIKQVCKSGGYRCMAHTTNTLPHVCC